MTKDEIRERLVELIGDAPVWKHGSWDEAVLFVANHLIANGVTVQEWIPDAEQTPEVDPETGYRDVAVLTESRKLQIATWDGSNYYIEISKAEDLDDTITHWAYLPPLPELPKEVE